MQYHSLHVGTPALGGSSGVADTRRSGGQDEIDHLCWNCSKQNARQGKSTFDLADARYARTRTSPMGNLSSSAIARPLPVSCEISLFARFRVSVGLQRDAWRVWVLRPAATFGREGWSCWRWIIGLALGDYGRSLVGRADDSKAHLGIADNNVAPGKRGERKSVGVERWVQSGIRLIGEHFATKRTMTIFWTHCARLPRSWARIWKSCSTLARRSLSSTR